MSSPRIVRRFACFRLALAIACTCAPLLPLSAQSSSPVSTPPPVPVLIELFTSEGCSDCPPADALLQQLDLKQPIPGAQTIVLSEHVTYWNHNGWRDPFSLDAMTERQEKYVHRFGLDSSYTPQMVVDGTMQLVGNDARAALAAVTNAAKTPKQPLSIENATWDRDSVIFSLRGAASSRTNLVAALASDATHSEVTRGENAGRTLHHTAVVRVMKEFSSESSDGRTLKLSGADLNGKGNASGPLRLVVFLVDRKTGHVLAVAQQTLQP